MALDRIRLSHFRNHAASEITGTAHFNLLIGENGAGKTNVLEAISLLAPGRGLRRAALSDMVERHGTCGFAVSAELTPGGVAGAGPVRIGTGTLPDRPARRVVQINGADSAAVALSEWLGLFWLTPAMDRLFMDSPGARRRFLDRMVLALVPAHARHAARYDAALRERARLLFDDVADARWLDAIEMQLAQAGAQVAAARMRLIEALSAAIATLPPSPFARPALALQPGGPADVAALAQALADSRRRDQAAQRSLVGPHRDELVVTLAAKRQPAAECSTGEQKAMLIAITLAHCNLSDDGLGWPEGSSEPRARVLLLDEVAAHLDPLRRAALFEQLRGGPAQVWITGTEAAPFDPIREEAAGWQVTDGVVAKEG